MDEPTTPKIERTEVLYFDHNGHPLADAAGAEQVVIIEYDEHDNPITKTYGHPGGVSADDQEE
jgi:hypothetical protein